MLISFFKGLLSGVSLATSGTGPKSPQAGLHPLPRLSSRQRTPPPYPGSSKTRVLLNPHPAAQSPTKLHLSPHPTS